VVLLARRLPCSLPLPTAQQRRHQRTRHQQITQPAQRRQPVALLHRRGVGPRLRDHPLAAVGQHHQQLCPAVAAQPAQHRHPLPVQRILPPVDRHDAHRCSPRPTPTPPGVAWPPAQRTACTTRPTSTSSKVDRHLRRSTGTPAAILAAIRSTHPSLPEHGNPPAASASTAAGQSTTANRPPPASARPTHTNRPTNSPRHSQRRCPISNSTAASASQSPLACARNAAANSSKHVVCRGFL